MLAIFYRMENIFVKLWVILPMKNVCTNSKRFWLHCKRHKINFWELTIVNVSKRKAKWIVLALQWPSIPLLTCYIPISREVYSEQAMKIYIFQRKVKNYLLFFEAVVVWLKHVDLLINTFNEFKSRILIFGGSLW